MNSPSIYKASTTNSRWEYLFEDPILNKRIGRTLKLVSSFISLLIASKGLSPFFSQPAGKASGSGRYL
jgi:hypothetical protein